jgi:hypothetical protein
VKSKKSAPKVACPAPADWPEEACTRVLQATGCSTPELRAAFEAVHDWAEAKDLRRTLRGWEATARRAVKEQWAKPRGNGAAARPIDPQRMTGSQILDFLEAEDAEADFINAKEIN